MQIDATRFYPYVQHPDGRRIGKVVYKDADGSIKDNATGNYGRYKVGLVEFKENTLEAMHAYRTKMVDTPSTAFILGFLSPDRLENLQKLNQNGICCVYSAGQFERDSHNFIDAPRQFLCVDFDNLPMPEDIVLYDNLLAEMFFDALADAGLDWLARDCVMHVSSKHGVANTTTMRAHVLFLLKDALTVAQQKSVARYINIAFREAGYEGDVCDLKLYTPEHMLYTSLANYYEEVDHNYVTKPLPDVQRVRIARVPFDAPVEVPEDALDFVDVVEYASETREGAGIAHDRRFVDGNVDNASLLMIKDYVFKTYNRTYDDEYAAQDAIFAQVEENILAMDASRAKTEQRLSDFRRKRTGMWNWSVNTRYGQESTRPVEDKSISLEAARSRMASRFEDVFTMEQDHYKYFGLFIIPPGGGKTTTFLKAAATGIDFEQKRVHFVVPTVGLGKEIYEDAKEILPEGTRIYHYKGRKQYCNEEERVEQHEKCEKVEQFDISPRETVCKTCPFALNGECEWPNMKVKPGVGLHIFQHAHETSTLEAVWDLDSDLMPDIAVQDESMWGTYGPKERKLTVKSLRDATSKTVVRYPESKKADYDATNDLIDLRTRLLDMLEQQPEYVPLSALKGFRRELEDGMIAEELLIKQCRLEMLDLAKGDDFDSKTAQAKKIKHIKSAAELVLDLLRAMSNSAKTNRTHIFGLSVMETEDGGRMVVTRVRPPLSTMQKTVKKRIQLDATSDGGFFERTVWGGTHKIAMHEMDIRPKHYWLTQYVDRSFSDDYLTNDKNNKGGVKRSATTISVYIKYKAVLFDSVLVICTKKVHDYLTKHWTFPDNVNFMTFGSVRGRNTYKNADCVIQIGRMQPSVEDLEDMTEAVLAEEQSVTSIKRVKRDARGLFMPNRRQTRLVRRKDGTIGTFTIPSVPTHPDTNVQKVHYQITWAENEQGINRVRPLERTADNPVDMTIFGQFDSKIPIDEVRYFADEINEDRRTAELFSGLGLIPPPGGILIDKILGGIFQGRGKGFKIRATAYNQRSNDEWPQWRVVFEGCGTYKKRPGELVRVGAELSAPDVAKLVTALTGVQLTQEPERARTMEGG